MELGSSLLVRSEISGGISVVSALWHLWHFAQSLLSLSLTRSRQIKQTAGIPRGIWPLLFDFFTQNIILFSHLRSSALFSSHLLSQNSLLAQCVVSSVLSFLLSYHFFWINPVKPPNLLSCAFTPYFVLLHSISWFVLPQNAPMNHLTLLVLLGQALP